MIIIMNPEANEEDIISLSGLLQEKGFKVSKLKEGKNTIIHLTTKENKPITFDFKALPGVEKCIPLAKQERLLDKKVDEKTLKVRVGKEVIGGNKIVMMAGPCAVESESQIMQIARSIKEIGATFLRGGAYKPRTSPYSFQGLELEGLKLLRQAADEYNLKVVSEVTSEKYLDNCLKYCDMLQIGARNMQNFELLKAVGKTNTAVLLKRSPGAKIEEWLGAAEYIIAEGNRNIVLCERGINTFENATRYTLDISAVPIVKSKTSLPIIVDPSHASGNSALIHSLSLASLAAGADGLLIEAHNDPKFAISDARQQLTPKEYEKLFLEAKNVSKSIGRKI